MRKFLMTAVAVVAIVGTAHAEDNRNWLDGPGYVNLACTPVPVPNAKPERDPVVQILTGVEWKSDIAEPFMHAVHIHASGKRSDRADQYTDFTVHTATTDQGRGWWWAGIDKKTRHISTSGMLTQLNDGSWNYSEIQTDDRHPLNIRDIVKSTCRVTDSSWPSVLR